VTKFWACSGKYNSLSQDAAICNPSFAEQENEVLASLKKGAANMHPLTVLWLVRLSLYKLAKRKQSAVGKR
jgi:hypothetical protein